MQSDERPTEEGLVDRMLAWYGSQPWLRAVIQAIPYGGGPADTLLAWRALNLNKRRVEELFGNISERLSSVEESSLDKEFLQSEQFFDLLRNCADIVAKTSSEYKRKHVADFLAGTIVRGQVHDLSQQIAEDLRVIQDFHLRIITSLPRSLIPNVLRTEGEREKDKIIDFHKLREIVGMEWGMFNKSISDLERFGFIRYTSEATSWVDGDIRTCRPTHYLAVFNNEVSASVAGR
jgi:predicted RNA-binding protein with EMAP domain